MSMRFVDTETIAEYAAEDADVTLQLKKKFEPMLHMIPTLKNYITK